MIGNLKDTLIFKCKSLLLRIAKSVRKFEVDLGHPNKKRGAFKTFGNGSFFWGDSHFISGHSNFEIGENVHINNNSYIVADGGLKIGDNTHISRNLVLYTRNHDYKGQLLPYDSNFIYKPVEIGRNVWIGMNVCIAPGTKIGDGCIIGMGTVVSGTIPALSIVGSPKCQIIGQRDEGHYQYLEENELYGGISGRMYGRSKGTSLSKIGDVYRSVRSNSEVVMFNGTAAVKKTYHRTPEGTDAWLREKEAYDRFRRYNWCPKLFHQEDHCLIMEYFPSETRFDITHAEKTKDFLGSVLWVLFEIWFEGYSHCDFHGKNIFLVNGEVKVIDFETIREHESKSDFIDSYDFTGSGIESPFNSGGMHFFDKRPSSLASIFGVWEKSEILRLYSEIFKNKLLIASSTFSTRKNTASRHVLKNQKIYSSFELKHINVPRAEAQRFTSERFKNFRLNKENIEGKTILDIGSNVGGTLLNLAKFNPLSMTGMEIDADKVLLANQLAAYNGISNVKFVVADIEAELANTHSFDVVFCLAVIEHLSNKEALFQFMQRVCKEVLYFEGNSKTDRKYVEENLASHGFQKIEYLGLSNDESNARNNNRPMWIAWKRIP